MPTVLTRGASAQPDHATAGALQAAGLSVTSVLLYKLDYGPTDMQQSSSAAAPAPLAAVPIPASASHGLPTNTIAGARPQQRTCGFLLLLAPLAAVPVPPSAHHGLPTNTIASAGMGLTVKAMHCFCTSICTSKLQTLGCSIILMGARAGDGQPTPQRLVFDRPYVRHVPVAALAAARALGAACAG